MYNRHTPHSVHVAGYCEKWKMKCSQGPRGSSSNSSRKWLTASSSRQPKCHLQHPPPRPLSLASLLVFCLPRPLSHSACNLVCVSQETFVALLPQFAEVVTWEPSECAAPATNIGPQQHPGTLPLAPRQPCPRSSPQSTFHRPDSQQITTKLAIWSRATKLNPVPGKGPARQGMHDTQTRCPLYTTQHACSLAAACTGYNNKRTTNKRREISSSSRGSKKCAAHLQKWLAATWGEAGAWLEGAGGR